LYPLPKVTNSRKLLFISISCISLNFCVQIVKYLYKMMVCWKFHIIPMRNSQDMDDWNIYLHFWGHVRPGDSAYKCACAKIKNRNLRNFGFYIELFHSLKHFKRSSFILTSILLQSYEKIAAMSNSIEWRYVTDTCSVLHCKSRGSCNVIFNFRWMRRLCGLSTKLERRDHKLRILMKTMRSWNNRIA